MYVWQIVLGKQLLYELTIISVIDDLELAVECTIKLKLALRERERRLWFWFWFAAEGGCIWPLLALHFCGPAKPPVTSPAHLPMLHTGRFHISYMHTHLFMHTAGPHHLPNWTLICFSFCRSISSKRKRKKGMKRTGDIFLVMIIACQV